MSTSTPLLTVDVAQVADACVIRLRGEFDIAECRAVARALTEAEQSDAEALFLDLEGVTFIDACGLRTIFDASRRSASNGNRLQITRGTGLVTRMFRLTELDTVLPLADPCMCPAIRVNGARRNGHPLRRQPDRTHQATRRPLQVLRTGRSTANRLA